MEFFELGFLFGIRRSVPFQEPFGAEDLPGSSPAFCPFPRAFCPFPSLSTIALLAGLGLRSATLPFMSDSSFPRTLSAALNASLSPLAIATVGTIPRR